MTPARPRVAEFWFGAGTGMDRQSPYASRGSASAKVEERTASVETARGRAVRSIVAREGEEL